MFFASEVHRMVEHDMSKGQTCNIRVCCSLPPMPGNTESQEPHYVKECKASVPYDRGNGGALTTPRGHTFCLNRNLLRRKKAIALSKPFMTKESYLSYSFLFVL